MRVTYLLIIFVSLITVVATGQENRIRSCNIDIEFNNGQKTTEYTTITEVNQGNIIDDYSHFRLYQPHNGKIDKAEIITTSPTGKKSKFKLKDATVISSQEPYILATDITYYIWDVGKLSDGSTISFNYVVKENDASYAKFIRAISTLATDVFTVRIKIDGTNWRLKYDRDDQGVKYGENHDIYTFTWNDLPSLENPIFINAPADYYPGLWYQFESLDDKKDFSQWSDVYNWTKDFYENNMQFSDPDLQLDIASGSRDIFDTIMNKCRYVAVEIGEGRFCPPDPSTIWHNGYGDCKALAHLFISWLNLGGYKAWPVLVYSDHDRYGNENFPTPFYFDHVIAAFIDESGDTIYQDMTVKHTPYGYFPLELYGCFALPLVPDCKPFRLGYFPSFPDTVHYLIEGSTTESGALNGIINARLTGQTARTWNWHNHFTNNIDILKTTERYLKELIPRAHLSNFEYLSNDSTEIILISDISIDHVRINSGNKVIIRPWFFELDDLSTKTDSIMSWPTILSHNNLTKIDLKIKFDGCDFPYMADTTEIKYSGVTFKKIDYFNNDSLLSYDEFYFKPNILAPEEYFEYRDSISAIRKLLYGSIKMDTKN